ncbi:hypothetical protein BOTNAR_1038g00020 [Botryotinia narcissicola]|uniref:Major facilitator superfamily (MFS) profile domain-containing protein n=1 Tax=Botryotinia narcissicola TaxID=278944 RepID=A0A4Z1HG33_9HELO|nr:hypothetical protein BOTNAR_1038g00020 [Botryotinia narcissicola]
MAGSQEQMQLNEGNNSREGENEERNCDLVRPLERDLKRLGDEGALLLGENEEENEDCENVHVHASEAENSTSEWSANKDYEGLGWWHRPSLYFLLPAFFIYALAFGGLIVPKLNLILSLVCRNYLLYETSISTHTLPDADNPQCRIPEIQALASKFTLYLTILSGLLSALMTPFLGSISDRHGRIRVLILSSFGSFAAEIISILAAKFPGIVHYNWFLLGAFLDGICGSFTTEMAIIYAYASDCTAPPKRAVAFGYFHSCLFAGMGLGPLIAAFLAETTGDIITIFYFAISIHAIFMLFVVFLLPESHPKQRQQLAHSPFQNRYHSFHILRFTNLTDPFRILWPKSPSSSPNLRSNLVLLAVVDTLVFGIAMGSVTVIIYYSGYKFGWSTAQTSLFSSLCSISRVLVLILGFPLIVKFARRYRPHANKDTAADWLDLRIVRFSISLEVLGYVGYAVARTGPLFIVSGVFTALGGVGSPTLQSALTKHVPPNRVGQLLGVTGLLHAVGRVVCPVVFNLIYATTVKGFPQAVFVALAGSFALALFLSWFIRPVGELFTLDGLDGEDANEWTVNPKTLEEANASSEEDLTIPILRTIIDEGIGAC